ncbi:MAG: CHRD domain-containing protein [Vicinamibacterales bacterium]
MHKTLIAAALLVATATAWAAERDKTMYVAARLKPSNEVPAVSSPAAGAFRAVVDLDTQIITYELTYEDLQANVVMSHIHFAQPNVNGAIMVWLCGTATNPGPAGTQACPQSGTIAGTIMPSQIQTAATQGIASGEFEELAAAIQSGLTYVNVHTVQSPGGELRGQLRPRD